MESAATHNMALISWLPVSTATGYNVYHGAKGSTLGKMTLLATSASTADLFYFVNSASGTLLRTLSYVVAPSSRGAAAMAIEGPAVRVR